MNDNDLITRILPTEQWLAQVAEIYGTEPIDSSYDEEAIRQNYANELAEAERLREETKERHRRRLRRMQRQRAVERIFSNLIEQFNLNDAA